MNYDVKLSIEKLHVWTCHKYNKKETDVDSKFNFSDKIKNKNIQGKDFNNPGSLSVCLEEHRYFNKISVATKLLDYHS